MFSKARELLSSLNSRAADEASAQEAHSFGSHSFLPTRGIFLLPLTQGVGNTQAFFGTDRSWVSSPKILGAAALIAQTLIRQRAVFSARCS